MTTQKAEDLTLADIAVGNSVTIEWTVKESEIDAFADLSGDFNPLHMDADYAREAGFGQRVAHGYLLGAKISGLIGMKLPGQRCLLLEQTLAFPNPVYAGDRVTIRAQVKERHEEMSVIVLKLRAETDRTEKPITVARGTVTCKILS